MKLNLSELLKQENITDIVIDSRQVKKGCVFFALSGITSNGNDYIDQALESGAKIIVSDQVSDEQRNIFKVEDARVALAETCKWFFPNIPTNLIAVTGTSGKTSVVNYIAQIFGFLNIPAATIGSLGVQTNDSVTNKTFDKEAQALNTQDLVTFYKTLTNLKSLGIDHVAFEASSHGLTQGRMRGIEVAAAGFTSFSQDHLDYHETMEEYLKAKLQLFKDNLSTNGVAVINADMNETAQVEDFIKNSNKNYLTVGEKGDLKILQNISSISGLDVSFNYRDKNYNFKTNVIGTFQAANILIAALLVAEVGQEFDKVVRVLSRLNSVNGRLEKVPVNKNIFVDHSHKPEALKQALLNLKELKEEGAKLIVVFGCGGNRDKLKRPIMGSIAADIADMVIVTDDNPRFEDPQEIRKEILVGASKLSQNVIEIGDRKKAIAHAISIMTKKDVLLIAGKGHETYQQIKDEKIPFYDPAVVKEIVGVE